MKPKIRRFKERQQRIVKLHEHEKQVSKELAEDARKPDWVKQKEYGDYHYNDWDMEPPEKE